MTKTKKADAKRAKNVRPAGGTKSKLPVAMTGKASAAKPVDGDAPVFAYIATLPQPQRSIAERIDAIAARTLPGLQRAVKWGMAYYGLGGGWCFSSGAFVGHVKLMFIHGTTMQPEPPVTPMGMGKATRGVEIGSLDDLGQCNYGGGARLLRRQDAVSPYGQPPAAAVGVPILHQEGLGAARLDPQAEPGQFVVPQENLTLGRFCGVYGPFGELRHEFLG